MAIGVSAISLLFLLHILGGKSSVCQDASGINSFGQRTHELLEEAEMVRKLLEVTHPRGGHRNRRFVRSAELAVASSALSNALGNASLPVQLQFTDFVDKHTPSSCRSCYIIAHSIISRIRQFDYGDREEHVELFFDMCTRLNVSTPDICRGVVEINIDVLLYVLKESPEVDTIKVCSNFLTECDDGRPELKWPLKESFGEQPHIKPQPFITNLKGQSKTRPVRILHVTDFHFDKLYKVGGNAECGLPLCCRSNQGEASNTSVPAGRWGDYRQCDIPWDTVVEFCNHVAETQKVDFVYFTGDIIDHGVWATSREGNIRMIRDVYQHLNKTFGTKTKVFPIVGNHEPHPLNQFAPGDAPLKDALGSKWLYELMAEEWSYWLPADTRETILKGGYYTVRINSKFRIIALNTMFCYNLNWWLMYDPVDPAGQLSWLVKVLKEAEAADEKVHILSHIPPGSSDCLHTWSEHFWQIIKRFSDTIVGQFNGHSHLDEMRIFYTDDGKGNAYTFNAAFNGGSLTTYADVNPNYKIYLVDGYGKDASWERGTEYVLPEKNGNVNKYGEFVKNEEKKRNEERESKRQFGEERERNDVSSNRNVSNYWLVCCLGRGSKQVKDAEVWSFNLTDANSKPSERPHWFKMHTFAQKYKIPSMHVSHLDTLVRRFASDRETRYLYWKLLTRESDTDSTYGCDDNCLRQVLCNLVTTETRNHKYCHLFFDKMR